MHFGTVKYVSTRGSAPELDFDDVLLAGLARDGGLYVPAEWPKISTNDMREFAQLPYAELACRVMAPFVGNSLAPDQFEQLVNSAYERFDHAAITPLRQLGANDWLLELFHGPTLAFKDVALQLLGQLFEAVLEKRQTHITVVCATSGDTGSAAIEAMRGRHNAVTFVLHPHERVSEVQRRQMTTVHDANIHNIAVRGTFDDCQAMVKALFNDAPFRDAVSLAGVNSINWARVMAQTVYYFWAGVALGAPDRPISFVVPTGNFGDIFAGYVAMRMGLPIKKLVIATNVNDILYRALESGRYETGNVVPTMSPSMDIQVSSNFERLLFDAYDRDAQAVVRLMDSLTQSGSFTIEAPALKAMRKFFVAERVTEDETRSTISQVFEETGMLTDPHTAVGIAAARKAARDTDTPVVTLATAHPAKFPDAVVQATGTHPALPAHLADLLDREERYTVLDNDLDAIKAYMENANIGAD